MPNLVHAIQTLLEEVEAASIETTRIELPIESVHADHVVPWMAKQAVFPKFYWQSRDTTEETVALGQARTFSDINPAYSVLSSNQRIWGGYAFPRSSKHDACLSSYFFLPQIELLSVVINGLSQPIFWKIRTHCAEQSIDLALT